MNEDLFPSEELILSAESGNIDAAAALDAAGFILRPGETPAGYASRIRGMRSHAHDIEKSFEESPELEIYPGLKVTENDSVPPEIIADASPVTEAEYAFSVKWVGGFFPSRGLGPLWAGCSVSGGEDDDIPVFLIRRPFRDSPRWFIYDREELLAHELCHAARAPLDDPGLEEHFAYGISKSALRRAIGNCFRTDMDAVLFVLPVLLLLIVQLCISIFGINVPVLPFWIIAFAYPAFLLTRNFIQRRRVFKAAEKLKNAGFSNPCAVLFRCTEKEIYAMADTPQETLASEITVKAENELRWRVICARFMKKEETTEHPVTTSDC